MTNLHAAKAAAVEHIRASEAEAESQRVSVGEAHDEVRSKLSAVTDELALLEQARMQRVSEARQAEAEAEQARSELHALRQSRSEERTAAQVSDGSFVSHLPTGDSRWPGDAQQDASTEGVCGDALRLEGWVGGGTGGVQRAQPRGDVAAAGGAVAGARQRAPVFRAGT